MKKSNLKTRIAAFALATISVTSVATATVPMVSAANMKQKNSIDQLQLSGKDVYKRAQKELIDIAKNTFKELPGGKYIVEFFDYCLTFVGNTFDEEKKESSLSLEDIKKQLDELKQYIVDVSVDVKLMKNKNFDDAIDEISWICDECYPKLEALVAAKCELLDAEKNGNENILMEKQIAFNLALEDVKSISYTEIKSKLQKAMYYMTEHSISNPNPFINFYEAHKAKYDYGKDAIEETNKQYDEKVWKIFYAGLAIYDAVIQVNIDELCADPATEAYGEKMAKDYARFLNGDGAANDTTSVVYVTKYYQKAVNEKAKHINEYSYDTDKSAFFNDLAMGRIDVSGFFSVGDKKNMDIIRFIDKNGSGADNARYKEYFNAVKHLIEEQYMSRDNHKMTLRHFLEENFNIKVPENAKYLVCGQVVFKTNNIYGEILERNIPLIELDASRANIEYVTYEKSFEGAEDYYKTSIDGLCYFVPDVDEASEKVAEVIYKGETLEFSSLEEAWNFVSENSGCVLKLYTDWVAKKNSDDNFTTFGDGIGFERVDGKKTYYGALYVRNHLIIDINGHTIDRNQDVPVEDGSVFIIDKDGAYLTIINSADNKGTITGGNTKGRGGAINDMTSGVCGDSAIKLNNVTVTGNHAVQEGGGISYSCCSTNGNIVLNNCDIVDNTSDKNGGGVFAEVSGIYATDVTLDGTVNVTGNTVNGKANNFTFDDNFVTKAVLKFNPTFSKHSRIGVNTTSSDKTIDFTEGNSNIKNFKNVFTSDSTNRQINIYKGFLSDKYYAELKMV